MKVLSHAFRRRRSLRRSIDVEVAFEQWEESCVPSYVHPNPLAAYVSWKRLFVAADLARQLLGRPARVLDFGSSVGELSHILDHAGDYEFVELDDASAEFLLAQNGRARRRELSDVPLASYDAIFAIDSLEHNENYRELLGELAGRLAPGGVLVLSGPTENVLYRLGRKIAGFKGDYHVTTIYDIEREATAFLDLVEVRTVPFGISLFRITGWRRRAGSGAL
jgi:2-polyprenyl-3-methyl-5-hydroxy-6-metoxy-1,4-benzoquinol methylase